MDDKEYLDYLQNAERRVEREIPLQEDVKPEEVAYSEDVSTLIDGANKFVEALDANDEGVRAKQHKVLIDEFVAKYKTETTDETKTSCVDRFKINGLNVNLNILNHLEMLK